MMGKPITMDQLRQDVGNMVEKITKVIAIFRQFHLKMEEYVCLKVIAMVSQDGKCTFTQFLNITVANTNLIGITQPYLNKHIIVYIFRSGWSQFVRYPR